MEGCVPSLLQKYSSIRVNTVIKLYILVLLYNGPKHGYEIMK